MKENEDILDGLTTDSENVKPDTKADHRIKLKESEEKNKYLGLASGLKKL